MKKILFVNACVRPESRTYRLAQSVLSKIEGEISEIALDKLDIPPLNNAMLEQREAYEKAGDYAHPIFDLAKQFAQADEIVMAAPYWDLSFPASVKLYVEAVSVSGITFKYTPQGLPQGLCRAKRLIYVTTAGGFIGNKDLGFQYIKALCMDMYGINSVQSVSCEGLDIIGTDVEAALEQAKNLM